MTNYELMDLLGRAFAYGEVDNIASHLAQNCEYESEYAHRRVQTAGKIIERIKQVYSNITDESRYTYQIIPLDNILREIKFEEFSPVNGLSVMEFGLLLFRYSDKYPVAVVVAMQDDNGKLGCIQLSRNTSRFNVDFYMEEIDNDSPYDLPLTVQPLQIICYHLKSNHIWMRFQPLPLLSSILLFISISFTLLDQVGRSHLGFQSEKRT